MSTPTTTSMPFLSRLAAPQKNRIAKVLTALSGYASGRPVDGFAAALGVGAATVGPLLKELEAERFIRVSDGRVYPDTNTRGGGTVTFAAEDARRRTELLAKSPAGRAVLAAERGR